MSGLLGSRERTGALFLLGAAAIAWVVTVQRMDGMDAGPGTDLGGLAWYLGVWVTMTAAMMLPSAVPAARAVARAARGVPALPFAVGYLAAWTAYGVAAYGLFRLVTAFDTDWLAWDRGGPWATSAVIVAAGLYELTPVKRELLRRCRDPIDVERHGALRTGLANRRDCGVCCLGLMAVLFALGVMSVLWMAVVAGVILVEKVVPWLAVTRVVAVALIAVGVWVAVSPSSVPGLTEPGMPSPMMEMAQGGAR